MRGAFRIGSVGGIAIRVHFSFLLVLPFLAYLFAQQLTMAARVAEVPPSALSGPPLLWGLGLAVALFLGVLVHEFAHAFYALRKGGKVRGITLLMIGGVSEVTEPPREVKQEAVMALVGPLTSLALGALFFGLFRLSGGVTSFNVRFSLFYLAQINLILGLFNLLPAFPMDGGRVLRALLAAKLGMSRGTQIAVVLGKVFAALFAVAGILTFNLMLLFIAYFVFLGADGESRTLTMRAVLDKVSIREVMTATTASVDASEPVARVADRMLSERRLMLPVTQDGQVVGMTTLEDVRRVPPERREVMAAEVITRPAPALSPDDDVWKALREMEQAGLPQLPVLENGQLIGVLSREDVARRLQLQALSRPQRGQPPRLPLHPDGHVPA